MKNWFLQKNDQEQKILVILAIFSVLLLLISFLYLPIKRNNVQLQSSIDDISNEITIMQNMEKQLAGFANIEVETTPMDDAQMMALIEQIATQQQLTVSNIKSQGKNKISVTLSSVPFNAAIRWLDTLQTAQHLTIHQLTVAAEKKGLTTINVILTQ